jgi:excisionase family DNA binding protein
MSMSDDAVTLAYVARLLDEHRRRSRRNGWVLPLELEAAWAIANHRQDPPQIPSGVDPRNVLVMTYAEAADRLGVSQRTVERVVASGALPTVAIGGCKRVAIADLVQYVDAQRHNRSVRLGVAPSPGDGIERDGTTEEVA